MYFWGIRFVAGDTRVAPAARWADTMRWLRGSDSVARGLQGGLGGAIMRVAQLGKRIQLPLGCLASVLSKVRPPVAEDRVMADVDKELLAILVCPQSHAPLVQVGDWLYSTDQETRLRYPIRDGIPVMLIDESETVEVEEFKRVMSN